MEQYSRHATLQDLKALSRSLNAAVAQYHLIGGYALFAHAYHRATTYVDVLVPATREAGVSRRTASRRQRRPAGTRRQWTGWGGDGFMHNKRNKHTPAA